MIMSSDTICTILQMLQAFEDISKRESDILRFGVGLAFSIDADRLGSIIDVTSIIIAMTSAIIAVSSLISF